MVVMRTVASMAMPLLEPQARTFSAAMWRKDTKTTSRDGLGESASTCPCDGSLSNVERKHIRDSNRSADAVRGVVERPAVEDPIRNSPANS